MAAVVVATIVTDYLVVGTTITVLSLPVFLLVTNTEGLAVLAVLVATVVIIAKHMENYVRIAKGTEFGLRKALKKEYRVESERERV